MIANFTCKETEKLFREGRSRRFSSISCVAIRKLDMLDAAINLDDLRIPPSNHLEVLLGKRKGQHSIRINAQWRLCFEWREGMAYQVEIVDYH